MKNTLLLLPLLGLLIACKTTKTEQQSTDESILSIKNIHKQLSLIMPGIYTNSKQHEAAPDDYYHIIMKIYRIWDDRDDGSWFYIEQSQFKMQERPYRQRVYQLVRGEKDTLISKVLDLPDTKEAIGKGENEDFWDDLAPDDLTLREGCSVYLTRQSNGLYAGGTRGTGCANSLAKASYARSEVTVSLEKFTSLDRGYDAKDKQVWGSEIGPYIFTPYEE